MRGGGGAGGGARGDKFPMQRGFIKNSAGDLLHAIRFLGRLYNFCKFVIMFSFIQFKLYVEEQDIFQIWIWSNTTTKRVTETESQRKLKTT